MILLEELQELVGVSPLGFVVILDHERLAGPGWSGLGETEACAQGQQRQRQMKCFMMSFPLIQT